MCHSRILPPDKFECKSLEFRGRKFQSRDKFKNPTRKIGVWGTPEEELFNDNRTLRSRRLDRRVQEPLSGETRLVTVVIAIAVVTNEASGACGNPTACGTRWR